MVLPGYVALFFMKKTNVLALPFLLTKQDNEIQQLDKELVEKLGIVAT